MASSNFQTQKRFSHLLAISLTFFLLLLNKVNSSESLAFRFPDFKTPENLILQGDAKVTSGKLELTKVENGVPQAGSVGRALYGTPVHIWDKSTGSVASFATYFKFSIHALDENNTADGLAFFIAPVDTQPGRGDGYLGLFNDSNYNSSYQTLAIEIDTFSNLRWDPKGLHIGIDVNSIKSTKTTPWVFRNNEVATVVISYLAPIKTLLAYLLYPSGKTSSSYIISDTIDLKSIVPERVRVGLSASSTTKVYPDYAESHDVHSWSFKSILPDGNSGVAVNDLDLASSMLDDSMDLSTY